MYTSDTDQGRAEGYISVRLWLLKGNYDSLNNWPRHMQVIKLTLNYIYSHSLPSDYSVKNTSTMQKKLSLPKI